jgi:heptosyltransferase-2
MALNDRTRRRCRSPEGERAEAARVVVVSPTWIGDVVMSLPLVGLLASAPEVRLTVAARGAAGRVYWGVNGVSDLVASPDAGRARRIGVLRAVVRTTRAEGALILPPSFSSAFGCWLGGARTRVGFRSDARRLLLSASLDPRPLIGEHLSDNYLRLGRLLLDGLGVRADRSFVTPKPRIFERERAAVREKLERALTEAGVYAVVVPGASYGPAKSWPAEKYRELVRRLSMETFVVLAGAGPERALCAAVADGLAGVANLAGQTSLGEFMALLGGAGVVVANDSGAPHLAASLGVPVVVIFGSTSPRWTSPLGESVRVVYEPVHCSPCFRKRCPTRLECFEAVSAERVFEAARSSLRVAR